MMQAIFSKLSISLSATVLAIANLSIAFSFAPFPCAHSVARAAPPEAAPAAPAMTPRTITPGEVDPSLAEDYRPTPIYIHDPVTHELVPKVALVTPERSIEGAVEQIVNAYEGQDIGIKSYEVKVDASSHAAQINFNVDHPRAAKVFQSLSSTSQYSLFEAIRETLSLPVYRVEEVIFSANGQPFDI